MMPVEKFRMLLRPPIDEGTLRAGMFGRVTVDEGFGPED